MLHRRLDTWTGVGLIAVGVERLGYRLSLTHLVEGEWRAIFMGPNELAAPKGFGLAETRWRAVQLAAWAALRKSEAPDANLRGQGGA